MRVSAFRNDQPAEYRIRVQGYVADAWSDRMSGLRITYQGTGSNCVTTLQGQLADQAALFGILVGLYDMRLPVLSVECLFYTPVA